MATDIENYFSRLWIIYSKYTRKVNFNINNIKLLCILLIHPCGFCVVNILIFIYLLCKYTQRLQVIKQLCGIARPCTKVLHSAKIELFISLLEKNYHAIFDIYIFIRKKKTFCRSEYRSLIFKRYVSKNIIG